MMLIRNTRVFEKYCDAYPPNQAIIKLIHAGNFQVCRRISQDNTLTTPFCLLRFRYASKAINSTL